MTNAQQDFAKLLLMRDRVGARSGAHFDNDSRKVTGPLDSVRAKQRAGKPRDGANTLSFGYVRDPKTGEPLSR